MLAFVATGGVGISIVLALVTLYASTSIYGRYGWRAWEAFKRDWKLGKKAWSKEPKASKKLGAALSAMLDLNSNGRWQTAAKYFSLALGVAVAAFSAMIGGYALFSGIPAFLLAIGVTAVCPPLALAIFVGIGAISGMIMSTALYAPVIYSLLNKQGKALDNDPRGVGPFQVLGYVMNKVVSYGFMFGAGAGVALALGSIAFPVAIPAVVVSGIIIGGSIFGMGLIAGIVLPITRWAHTKIYDKSGYDISFSGLGRGIDILCKITWNALITAIRRNDNADKNTVDLPKADEGKDIRATDKNIHQQKAALEAVKLKVLKQDATAHNDRVDPRDSLSSSCSSVNSQNDPAEYIPLRPGTAAAAV
jgi:hypothetical protein